MVEEYWVTKDQNGRVRKGECWEGGLEVDNNEDLELLERKRRGCEGGGLVVKED